MKTIVRIVLVYRYAVAGCLAGSIKKRNRTFFLLPVALTCRKNVFCKSPILHKWFRLHFLFPLQIFKIQIIISLQHSFFLPIAASALAILRLALPIYKPGYLFRGLDRQFE